MKYRHDTVEDSFDKRQPVSRIKMNTLERYLGDEGYRRIQNTKHSPTKHVHVVGHQPTNLARGRGQIATDDGTKSVASANV